MEERNKAAGKGVGMRKRGRVGRGSWDQEGEKGKGMLQDCVLEHGGAKEEGQGFLKKDRGLGRGGHVGDVGGGKGVGQGEEKIAEGI